MIMYRFYRLDKNKKATRNSINHDNKYFQYAATVTSNHKEIGKKFLNNIKSSVF